MPEGNLLGSMARAPSKFVVNVDVFLDNYSGCVWHCCMRLHFMGGLMIFAFSEMVVVSSRSHGGYLFERDLSLICFLGVVPVALNAF